MSSGNKSEPTLSTGKYDIQQSNGAAVIYAHDERGNRHWVASTSDPQKAMDIVEGLVLVEMKRFYYPDSTPQVSTAVDDGRPVPPFLQRKG